MGEPVLLDYGPRREPRERYRSRRWIAWPARAFRVIAPRRAASQLNCLQRAVLALLRASALSNEELAHALGLVPELVGHVVAELQAATYLDGARGLSSRGRELLAHAAEADADLVPAWVFADPWTGELWPFVAETLARVELREGPSGGWPRIVAGESATHSISPWWVPHPGQLVSPPSAEAILRAAGQHAEATRWWQGHELDEGEALLVSGPSFDRLGAIESTPVGVHLLTYAYVSEDSGTEWTICEPFGRGASSSLRRRLCGRAELDARLHQLVDTLLDGAGAASFDALRKLERTLELEAERALSLRLGLGARDEGTIYPHLRDALVELEAARALSGAAQGRRSTSGGIACRKALEALLARLCRDYPLHDVQLSPDPQLREQQIRAAAAVCGLSPLPDPLLRVTPGQLRSVIRYTDSWRARPLLVATMAGARHDPAHPLRVAAVREPALLERFDRVLNIAGHGGHADEAGPPSLLEIELAVHTTIDIVGLLLDLHPSTLEQDA